MEFQLQVLAQGRKNFVGLLEPFSTEQVNTIPPGYKNNLIWNLAHVIVSQQLLCYQRSGIEPTIPSSYINEFKRGTTPETTFSSERIEEFKNLAITTADQFIEDYQAGTFQNYESYQSLFGVKITNIEEAIVFNNAHEGLHLGYILAMRKLV